MKPQVKGNFFVDACLFDKCLNIHTNKIFRTHKTAHGQLGVGSLKNYHVTMMKIKF